MFKILKSYVLSFLLTIILNVLFLTCSWKTIEPQNIRNAINKKRPLLLCFWHSRSLMIARYFKYKKIPVWGVSSTHPDSEILARVLRFWGIKLIRGSSSRGWFNVIKQMIVLFKNSNTIISVTADGPKGPKKVAKPGSAITASKHNAQVLAVSALSNKYWEIPSWDKTKIPKPFSTIYIRFSVPFNNNIINSNTVSSFINDNQNNLTQYINKNV